MLTIATYVEWQWSCDRSQLHAQSFPSEIAKSAIGERWIQKQLNAKERDVPSVYDAEVEQIRAVRQAERRAQCESLLSSELLSKAELTQAVITAQTLGIDASLVTAAERRIQQIIECEAKLASLLPKRQMVEVIKQANALNVAQSIIAEAKQRVQQITDCESMLSSLLPKPQIVEAVTLARELGLDEALIAVAEQRIQQMTKCETTLCSKLPKPPLVEAIEEAKSFGVDQALIAKAEQRVQQITDCESTLCSLLTKPQIVEAVTLARELGLDETVIAVAEQRIQQMTKCETILCSKLPKPQLVEAIVEAKSLGVDQALIAKAEQRVRQITDCESTLRSLLPQPRIADALTLARELQIDEALIARAQARVDRIAAQASEIKKLDVVRAAERVAAGLSCREQRAIESTVAAILADKSLGKEDQVALCNSNALRVAHVPSQASRLAQRTGVVLPVIVEEALYHDAHDHQMILAASVGSVVMIRCELCGADGADDGFVCIACDVFHCKACSTMHTGVVASSIDKKLTFNKPVRFYPNSATIMPDSEPILECVARLLRDHPVPVQIEGHANGPGTKSGDLRPHDGAEGGNGFELSKLRAARVAARLREHGVDEMLLFPIGVGSTRRIVEAYVHKNMRVETIFMPLG